MSVIAVFPQKTGDLMFVGFDSQNTFVLEGSVNIP